MGLADLHIHTIYSYDGTASVPAVLARAKQVGLDVIAITDHDEIKGALKAFELAPEFGIEVIPGIEITTAEGDLLALFVTEKIEPGLSLIGTIIKVGEAGGICIAPHPMARGVGMKSLSSSSIIQALRHPDASRILIGIETYNASALDRALRVKDVYLADGTQAFASDGAPSDCVALATLGFVKEPIDLVVSGINAGANLGHDVTYSGTVTAAMEAVIAGVPGIAVSLETMDSHLGEIDYGPAARAAGRVVRQVIENGLSQGILLNVNVPFLPDDKIHGICLTRQGLRVYHSRLDERTDPRGRPYYWIGGDAPTGVPEHGTDVGALAEGCVSVTPLQLDLTAYRALADLNTWHWSESSFETALLEASQKAFFLG